MEFVLVLPGEVHLDGIDLPVASPFYISTTELSNAQFAQLRHHGQLNRYADFAFESSMWARLDVEVAGCDLDRIFDYFSDPELPIVGVDLTDAAVVSARLSTTLRMHVRLPTLGEWFQAMRSGSPGPYWWDEGTLAERRSEGCTMPREVSCELMQELSDVNVGEQNALGIRNMLNNVAELVVPSDEERQMLRRRFGPNATEAIREPDRAAGMAISQHGALAIGGSVQTLSGWALLSADEFVATWEGILAWSQINVKQSPCYELQWATGMRLVIDLPDGEWRIREGGSER